MAATELEALLSSTPDSQNVPSVQTASTALSLLRNAPLHRPSLVLQLGDTVRNALSPISREHWDVAAQICSAATELGEREIAHTVFEQIIARFPHSVRAFVLLGRRHEARSDWVAAMACYIGIVKEKPMAPLVYKRQVAVLKSQMKMPEAISMLNYYLTYYSDDMAAWAELCALCLAQGRLSNALYAANELVVNDPGNHAVQTLVADVYMTCGGTDNVVLARKHYSCSLMARKHANLRSLYGLWLSCSLLKDNSLLNADEDVLHNDQLLLLAQNGIMAIYGKLGRDSNSYVSKVLPLDIVTGKKRQNGAKS